MYGWMDGCMYVGASYAVLGTILGRLGPSWASSRTNIEYHTAAMAYFRPPAVKMMIFHWFFNKNKKTLKKRYVLKATIGETQARIKKMSQTRGTTTIQPLLGVIVFQLQEAKLC